jgi:hypothetical protein
MNNVLQDANIPQSWKDADITPIPKKEAGKFRPISLLQTLGKIHERIVLARLERFTEDQETGLQEELLGFRGGRSTQLAVASLMEDIQFHRERGMETAVIFLDLEKAFELVDHRVVLTSLTELGVAGRLLAYVKNYLTSRRARVSVQGTFAPYQELGNGVPQVAVLSPLLFNAVISSLVKTIKFHLAKAGLASTNIYAYADDIAIWH